MTRIALLLAPLWLATIAVAALTPTDLEPHPGVRFIHARIEVSR